MYFLFVFLIYHPNAFFLLFQHTIGISFVQALLLENPKLSLKYLKDFSSVFFKISDNNWGYKKKNDKNLFIKLLIFCIRNLYGACSKFFHKIFDSAKEKRFDCSFWKFWCAEISAEPQNEPYKKE